jgi:TM2 domain-containing membrane protein YozV
LEAGGRGAKKMEKNQEPANPSPTQKCPFCAELVAAEAKKCKHCGETICVALRAAEEAKRAATSNGQQVFMNAGGGSAATSGSTSTGNGIQLTKTKSRAVAALLAFFFGGLGFHKFYLGQIGWGIVYLLFCWTFIPTIVAWIEGILYLLSTERQFALKYG